MLPIVNGLQAEYKGQLVFEQIDANQEIGQQRLRAYGLRGHPSYVIIDAKGATPDDLEPRAATIAYVFQYLIGNTDFSFSGLHNAELMAMPNGVNFPIAYDFDFAGVIDAPYAIPDTSLRISRVRDRQYRGFCLQNPLVPKVVQLFQDKKTAIYALYSDRIGALMTPKSVKETLEYFDAFYATIADPKEVKAFLDKHPESQCFEIVVTNRAGGPRGKRRRRHEIELLEVRILFERRE